VSLRRTKEPNNLRARWCRYRDTRKAYNFTYLPFRQWATSWGRNPRAYEANPFELRKVQS